LVINKKFLFLLLSVFASVFFFCICPISANAAEKPDDMWLERNAIYHGEEQDLILNVELSAREYVYLFIETPGGRFLDEQDEEFREPVLFGVFGPGNNVRCRIGPGLFDAYDIGVYNLYAVQHRSRNADVEDLGIENWEDLYDLSLQATLDVVGPYSATASFVTLKKQEVGKGAELSVTFQAEGTGRMKGVPPYDTDGKQRLYISTNRSSVTARLEARSWDNGWVEVKAEVSGSTLRKGVNIFALDWKDSRGKSYDTIYTFDDGCIYINLTSDDSKELVFQAARDGRLRDLLRNGEQTINFLQYELEEIYLDLDRYVSRAGERFKLVAYLGARDGDLEGIEVTFQERRDGGSWRAIGRADTDRYGEVAYEISREVAGSYEYRVEVLGEKSNIVEKIIVAGPPYEVRPEKSRLNVIARHEKEIRINYLDRYGNIIEKKTLNTLGQEPEDVMKIILTAPDRREINITRLMKVDKEGFYLEYDFPQEGIYRIEAFIAGTGISEICEVRSEEFGNESKLVLETDKKYLRARERSLSDIEDMLDDGEKVPEAAKLTATLYDDRGNSIKLDPDDLLLSMDKRNLANFYYGKEIWLIAAGGVSGELEITVIHEDSGLMDSLTVAVSGRPRYLDTDVEVAGNRATVTLTYLDRDRNPSAVLDKDEAGYLVLLPDGLTLVSQEDFEVGSTETSFVVEALSEQTYEIHVITDIGLLETITVDFMHLPAREVKMFIGSAHCLIDGKKVAMDMAPFITNSRTFVPVRFIAQAFGVDEDDIDWEPRTGLVEKIFIPYKNKLVTITIGSRTIYVVDDGVVSQVTSDAAASIRDGRTVLPLRAIGEIFGAEFDWGPKDADTEWVSFAR
jgi:hypothetical protein